MSQWKSNIPRALWLCTQHDDYEKQLIELSDRIVAQHTEKLGGTPPTGVPQHVKLTFGDVAGVGNPPPICWPGQC